MLYFSHKPNLWILIWWAETWELFRFTFLASLTFNAMHAAICLTHLYGHYWVINSRSILTRPPAKWGSFSLFSRLFGQTLNVCHCFPSHDDSRLPRQTHSFLTHGHTLLIQWMPFWLHTHIFVFCLFFFFYNKTSQWKLVFNLSVQSSSLSFNILLCYILVFIPEMLSCEDTQPSSS